MKCPNCNFEQDSGNFCERCGSFLQISKGEDSQEEANEQDENHFSETDTGTTKQSEGVPPNSSKGDNFKRELHNYWSYFLTLIKNPSLSFLTNEKYYVYGLVNFSLFAVFYAISVYILTNSIYKSISGFFVAKSSMPFSYLISMVFFMIVLLAISFFSAFAMTKAAKSTLSFKKIVAQYGALLAPFVGLNAIAVIGAIIRSGFITIVPLAISSSFALLFVPVLFVYEKAAEANPRGQKVYFSLATVVLIFLTTFILGEVILERTIEQIDEMLYYLF